MDHKAIQTLGDLVKSGYTSKSVKQELRDNLVEKLANDLPLFEGIIGYDDTVIPELTNAILSKHNINLLGLRGQAKTRIARSMVNLLDEYIPVVEGSEINDDPLNPLSRFAKDLVSEKGDNTPVRWLHRTNRFFEKLATPDVTVADLIGDVDPIKAASLKLSYANEEVIHFGMIPRANRCIFVINELPDLQARIQVSLFNILQEGDIQIRGFQMRLMLDLEFVFTANPEDYTNRGSIVTPLKDRIGSQIMTHYPQDIETAQAITDQEVKLSETANKKILVPSLAKQLVEQIGFEARKSELIDSKSGVSARMSITIYENLLSTAEQRLIRSKDKETTVRMSDFLGITAAITGKVELVYEGEQEGAAGVASILLGDAVNALFGDNFREIKKLQKPDEIDEFDKVVNWFMNNSGFELPNGASNDKYSSLLNSVGPLGDVLEAYILETAPEDELFYKEFVLWALAENEKLSKKSYSKGVSFADSILDSLYS
ncbi:MAG: magnesium chelatase [Flavobacteriales bacterium]|nr:magnesium chelatase [Flavobacteriales bacterium]